MKNTRNAKIARNVALFYFTLAGFCQSLHAQSEIRLRLMHETVIVVSLMADQQGPFDFVLDTGTDTSIVDPSLARQLSLASLGHVELNAVTGAKTLNRSSLRTLAAGSAHAENVEVLIQDLAELRQVDSHIQGIAGQNFLARFNYLLDYRKHTLRLEADHEVRDAIEGDSVPMERSENMLLVTTEAQSSGRAKLRLLLDSCANLVLLTRAPSQAVDAASQQGWVGTSSNGQAGIKGGRVRELTVGSQQFRDIAVAVPAPQPSDADRVEDGLLPMALFKAVYVNNREGFVMFNPRPKKQ